MNKKISIILTMIICLSLCMIPTLTYASSYTTKITLKGVDRAPRLSMDTSSNKNLVLKLVENGSISSVKLEKIENNKSTILLNKDSKNNKIAKGITISSDLKEIKIAKSLLKTGSYTKFKITTYDNNSIDKNKLIAYFNVKMLKSKDDERGWYSVNNSPRLSYSEGFTITVKDYSKVKSLTIKDMNNNNAKVSVSKPLSGSTEYVKKHKIDLSKLKAKNDMYFLQITVVDNSGTKRVEEIIVKTEKTKVKVEDNSSKNTTTTNSNNSQETTNTSNSSQQTTTTTTTTTTTSSNNTNTNSNKNTTTKVEAKKNVTTLLQTIEGYSKQIQEDYKKGNYWEYSNNWTTVGEKRTYNSFKDAKNGLRTTNCARIVFWAFYDMGITTKKEDIYSNENGELKASTEAKNRIKQYAKIEKVNKTPNQLKNAGDLKAGDIFLYPSHTNIYAGDGRWYDAGRGSGTTNGKGNAYCYKTASGTRKGIYYSSRGIYRFRTIGPGLSSYTTKTAVYRIRLNDQS